MLGLGLLILLSVSFNNFYCQSVTLVNIFSSMQLCIHIDCHRLGLLISILLPVVANSFACDVTKQFSLNFIPNTNLTNMPYRLLPLTGTVSKMVK